MTTLFQQVADQVRQQVAAIRPFVGYAGAMSSGRIKLRRVTEATADDELYGMLLPFAPSVDDESVWIDVGGKPYCLGLNGRTAGPLLYRGSGSPEGSVSAAVGSLYLRTDGGTDTAVYRKESGSGNTGWVAIAQPSTVWVPHIRQAFSDTAVNNSSTSSWLDVVSLTTTLPSGTWTAEVSAWGRIGHDSDGNIDLRVVIDGTNGTTYTRSGPSSGAYPGGAMSSKSSVSSGSRTAKLQIKSGSSGTSTMTNAFLHFNAYRTA